MAKDAIQRGRFAPPPPAFSYGGDANLGAEFRETIALAHHPAFAQSGAAAAQPQQQAGQSQVVTPPVIIRGWHEGMTIPAEYYIDEDQYIDDERFLGQNLWFLADHEARIPKPGDYFLFQFGRGDSVIVLRDKANAVRAFHNVCRHRGSALCRSEEHPTPNDARLSVKQLGASGNSPVFRCPYHAWTYDLRGQADFGAQRHAGRFQDGRLGNAPLSRADHRGVHLPELRAGRTTRIRHLRAGVHRRGERSTGRRI